MKKFSLYLGLLCFCFLARSGFGADPDWVNRVIKCPDFEITSAQVEYSGCVDDELKIEVGSTIKLGRSQWVKNYGQPCEERRAQTSLKMKVQGWHWEITGETEAHPASGDGSSALFKNTYDGDGWIEFTATGKTDQKLSDCDMTKQITVPFVIRDLRLLLQEDNAYGGSSERQSDYCGIDLFRERDLTKNEPKYQSIETMASVAHEDEDDGYDWSCSPNLKQASEDPEEKTWNVQIFRPLNPSLSYRKDYIAVSKHGCSKAIPITVVRVNLSLDGVPEEKEESCDEVLKTLGTFGQILPVILTIEPADIPADQVVHLDIDGSLCEDEAMTQPAAASYAVTDLPKTFYLKSGEGFEISAEHLMSNARDKLRNGTMVKLVEPCDPIKRVAYHYTYTLDDPPICTVKFVANVVPDNETTRQGFANKIHFAMDSIPGSTLSWLHGGVAVYDSSQKAWVDDATFTTMPENNDNFGLKKITMTVDAIDGFASCTQEGYTKIFFHMDGVNHPNWPEEPDPTTFLIDANDKCNWYYYWRQGVIPELNNVVLDTASSYSEGSLNFYGQYDSTQDRIEITKGAPGEHLPSIVVYNRYNTSLGFEISAPTEGAGSVASTIAHEQFHQWVYRNWVKPGLPDADGDGVPDSEEGKEPYYFNENDPDTYKLENAVSPGYQSYGDQEFLCRRKGLEATYDASRDWSFPGSQWNDGSSKY